MLYSKRGKNLGGGRKHSNRKSYGSSRLPLSKKRHVMKGGDEEWENFKKVNSGNFPFKILTDETLKQKWDKAYDTIFTNFRKISNKFIDPNIVIEKYLINHAKSLEDAKYIVRFMVWWLFPNDYKKELDEAIEEDIVRKAEEAEAKKDTQARAEGYTDYEHKLRAEAQAEKDIQANKEPLAIEEGYKNYEDKMYAKKWMDNLSIEHITDSYNKCMQPAISGINGQINYGLRDEDVERCQKQREAYKEKYVLLDNFINKGYKYSEIAEDYKSLKKKFNKAFSSGHDADVLRPILDKKCPKIKKWAGMSQKRPSDCTYKTAEAAARDRENARLPKPI